MANKKKDEETAIAVVPTNSPAAIIRDVMKQGGASIADLKELLQLQKEYEAHEARKAFNKAMSDFKSETIEISKDKKVGYQTDKGFVGYSHASLANVVDKITAGLSKYGLSVSWRNDQTTQPGKIGVSTRISHALGHFEETWLWAEADKSGSKNSIQAIGSTITYLQRYGLLSITGLATKDQDDDGKGAGEEIISEEQLVLVRDWITSLEGKIDLKKFFGHFKIEKIEDLKKSQFSEAIQLFKRRQDEVKKGLK